MNVCVFMPFKCVRCMNTNFAFGFNPRANSLCFYYLKRRYKLNIYYICLENDVQD